MKRIFKFVISVLICEAAAGIGGALTAPAIAGWYQSLNKPAWTPSGAVIGGVWTVLYLLMALALYLVWAKNWQIEANRGRTVRAWNRFSQELYNGAWQKSNIIAIFAVQLVLNILWSFAFFYLKFPGLAFFELLALWVAILYTIINFWRVSRPAGLLLLPYILWVSFAGYLNFIVWQIN
jgi:tryptophan-rich sensory protein